jgi:hypothetical protein
MKISSASLVLAVLTQTVVARNCKDGLDYCGKTLLQIGISVEPCPLMHQSTNKVYQATTMIKSKRLALLRKRAVLASKLRPIFSHARAASGATSS